MKIHRELQGELCTLRQICVEDCTDAYVDWLNDPDVNRCLETKWTTQTRESIEAFVRTQIESEHSLLLAILSGSSGRHIGNIKLGPIHPHYQHADVSYFIGDKSEWKKGIASEAIRLICKYGFEELQLHRIEAGAYANAVGSQKALEKNGFKREAVFREQVLFEGEWIDVYRYGLLRTEFQG